MKKCLRSVLAKLWGVLLSFLLVTHGPSNSCTSEKPSWLRRDGGGVSIKGIWLWHCFLEHADLLPSSEGLGQVMGDELVTMTWAFRDRKKKLLFFFLKHIFCVQFIKSLIRLVGPRGGVGVVESWFYYWLAVRVVILSAFPQKAGLAVSPPWPGWQALSLGSEQILRRPGVMACFQSGTGTSTPPHLLRGREARRCVHSCAA